MHANTPANILSKTFVFKIHMDINYISNIRFFSNASFVGVEIIHNSSTHTSHHVDLAF